MTTLPKWLLSPRPGPGPVAPARRLRGLRFARRALGEFASLLSGAGRDREAGEPRGLLGELDPRAKVLGLIGLVVVTTLLSSWRALALDAALCAAVVACSRVPLRRLGGTWVAVPLFSVLLMLPATLNLVVPGEVVLPLWRPGPGPGPAWMPPEGVGISAAGLEAGARFATRSLLCVTLALVLAHTTRPDRLFRGLRAMGVPKVFVLLLTLVERYLWVLARCAEEIHMAKLSRTLAPGRLRQEQAWVAAGAGALFRKSRSLGDAVYLAMLSRGFTGEARLLQEQRWRSADTCFVAASALACGLLVWMDLRP